jgi:hypothetical protein
MLPFHKKIVSQLFPTERENDALVIVAPGLGLRTIFLSFLRKQSQRDLYNKKYTIIVNASDQDVDSIREEIGLNLIDLTGITSIEAR